MTEWIDSKLEKDKLADGSVKGRPVCYEEQSAYSPSGQGPRRQRKSRTHTYADSRPSILEFEI